MYYIIYIIHMYYMVYIYIYTQYKCIHSKRHRPHSSLITRPGSRFLPIDAFSSSGAPPSPHCSTTVQRSIQPTPSRWLPPRYITQVRESQKGGSEALCRPTLLRQTSTACFPFFLSQFVPYVVRGSSEVACFVVVDLCWFKKKRFLLYNYKLMMWQ